MNQLNLFIELTRLKKPIGFMLLMWPSWFGLANLDQPINELTSGSTFKNPYKMKSWELIDDAGCRGLTLGNAKVSEKHCNFFVNKGNAKFEDMKNLIDFVAENVLEKTGISLEKEIKILDAAGTISDSVVYDNGPTDSSDWVGESVSPPVNGIDMIVYVRGDGCNFIPDTDSASYWNYRWTILDASNLSVNNQFS